MKRRIYIPLMNSAVTPENREEYAKMISAAGAVRVFLATDRKLLFMRGGERDSYLDSLYENIKYFKNEGYVSPKSPLFCVLSLPWYRISTPLRTVPTSKSLICRDDLR